MDQEQLQALLDAIQSPAFAVRGQSVIAENAAFSVLHIGKELSQMQALAAAVQAPNAHDHAPVLPINGVLWESRAVSLGEVTLLILQQSGSEISVHALAHTARHLRGTLQQMYSALDLLDRALPEEDQKLDETISSLLQGVFRVERTADNLEYLQKLRSGTYVLHSVRLDLRAELVSMLEKAQTLLQSAGIRLIWETMPTTFIGSVDPKLLSLAFWNLISNAAQHAYGGTVQVKAERVKLTKLRLRVTDSGAGIPAEQSEKLTQRYAVSPDAAIGQSGVGVGLELVQSIAQLHGGSMAISLEPGGETTAALVFETNRPDSTSLHNDQMTFTASLDEGLVGLSDLLPRRVYDRRDILS